MPFSQSCWFSGKCQSQKRRFTASLSHYAPFMGYVPTEDEKTRSEMSFLGSGKMEQKKLKN